MNEVVGTLASVILAKRLRVLSPSWRDKEVKASWDKDGVFNIESTSDGKIVYSGRLIKRPIWSDEVFSFRTRHLMLFIATK